MIPYAELDRALARWKARSQGGGVASVNTDAVPLDAAENEATPMPFAPEELGSIPNAAASIVDGTGEIDASELEAYEDGEA